MARPRKRPGDGIYECVQPFAFTAPDGTKTRVSLGERVREGHPVLVGREDFFKPLEIQYEVEQATAAPGEKRGE